MHFTFSKEILSSSDYDQFSINRDVFESLDHYTAQKPSRNHAKKFRVISKNVSSEIQLKSNLTINQIAYVYYSLYIAPAFLYLMLHHKAEASVFCKLCQQKDTLCDSSRTITGFFGQFSALQDSCRLTLILQESCKTNANLARILQD